MNKMVGEGEEEEENVQFSHDKMCPQLANPGNCEIMASKNFHKNVLFEF